MYVYKGVVWFVLCCVVVVGVCVVLFTHVGLLCCMLFVLLSCLC